jgi:hypothetical protein
VAGDEGAYGREHPCFLSPRLAIDAAHKAAINVDGNDPGRLALGRIDQALFDPIRIVSAVELGGLSDGHAQLDFFAYSVGMANSDLFFDIWEVRVLRHLFGPVGLGLSEGAGGRKHQDARQELKEGICFHRFSFHRALRIFWSGD